MEDDVGIRKLVEFIFDRKFQVTSEMKARESSFPRCFLTDDFPQKLRCVLLTRQAVVSDLWQKAEFHFDIFCSNMLPSLEYYLNTILAACFIEHTSLNKVFDSFINVCGLVRFFGLRIYQKSGMDFSGLNADIVMEFYESVLKHSFLKCGGLQRFLGYIHQHKYLKWNLDINDLTRLDDLSDQVIVSDKLENEKQKEHKARNSGLTRQLATSKLKSYTESMVERIISTTSVKLFLPSSSHEQIQTKGKTEETLNEKANTGEENLRSEAALKSEHSNEHQRRLSSNSHTKSNVAAKTKVVLPNDSIVQTVIKYNRSKNAIFTHGSDQLLKTANGILNNLKDKIKSLIKVLDEYDKD